MFKRKSHSKVKNPCKVCCKSVSKKNGLQCQGSCGSWVHYCCSHYSPGKIKDIKAGIIKLSCLCPDCMMPLPKDHKENFANQICNTDPGKVDQTTSVCKPWPWTKCGKICSKGIDPWPVAKCGENCKKFSRTCSTPQSRCAFSEEGDTGKSDNPFKALKDICNTVGVLSKQINDLTCKMKQAMNVKNACIPQERSHVRAYKDLKARCRNTCRCCNRGFSSF